ncbi:hypothetical protein GCM10010975_33120 [Comamonas phosphati]|nr:hypothetical protein GCM10010975_33120 [Comamonas phosphati]
MRVDIYRRAEAQDRYSHLVVPEGYAIPGEAINTDWESERRGQDLDETASQWPQFGISEPGRQLRDKGYAITSVDCQTEA